MKNNPVLARYNRLVRSLAAKQDELQTITLWRKVRAAEQWAILEAWMLAQIAARQARFTDEEELNLADFKELRTEIRMLRRFLIAGKRPDEHVAKLESEVGVLKEQIAHCQRTGLDRDFSSRKDHK